MRYLQKHKIPFAWAASLSRELADFKRQKYQTLFDLFEHKLLGQSERELANGRTVSNVFAMAARRFTDNPKPENVNIHIYMNAYWP